MGRCGSVRSDEGKKKRNAPETCEPQGRRQYGLCDAACEPPRLAMTVRRLEECCRFCTAAVNCE